MTTINKHLSLLQGYYNFLSLGKFLEQIIKDNDISKYAVDLPIQTGDNTHFTLKWDKIKRLLKEIHTKPDQKNFFGYITEIAAFKGVFSITKELMDTNDTFNDFLRTTMWKQFFPFDQTIRFCRNILTHSVDSDITISSEDFNQQKLYLLNQEKYRIIFNFKYSEFIKERKWTDKYGIYIKIDFSKLHQWIKFFDLIPRHQLFLFAELCFNLSSIFHHQLKK